MGKQKPKASPKAKAASKTFVMGLTLSGYGRVNAGDEYSAEIQKHCKDTGINVEKYLK